MTRLARGAVAAAAVCAALLASPALALNIAWDVNPAQSSFKLTIPDQNVTIGTLSATMRLRNQNNTAWTQNTAPVDGLLATNVLGNFASVEFLGGSSSLVGVNSGSYRPNPASYNTASTDANNTAGQFSNTTSAAAVFAARVNATVSIITVNTGYISFNGVSYDIDSAVLALTGTSFVSNTTTLGLADSQINFDSIAASTTGIGDTIANSGPIQAVNANGAAGSIVACPIVTGSCAFGGADLYKITVPIDLPVAVSLSGVNLNGTATGALVGYAEILSIPEPATVLVLALGLAGLGLAGRRRSRAD